jgi:hypothetical protein
VTPQEGGAAFAAGSARGACLPPDQRLLTPDGYVAVAAIDVRDRVITGQGRARLVLGLDCRPSAGSLCRLRTGRGHVLRVAGGQPVLARRQEGVAEWVPAAALHPGDLAAVFGLHLLPAFARGGPGPEAPSAGGRGGPLVAMRREVIPCQAVDWETVATADIVPYRGPAYRVEIEEDHSFVSEGWIVAEFGAG